MATSLQRLNEIIERIRALGAATPQFAADGAVALREQLEDNIGLARGPDGTPWERCADGSAPLTGARKALRVSSHGTRIVAQLTGPEANHSIGKTRGAIARPILPSRKLAQPVRKALEAVFIKRFRTIMGSEG